MARSSIAKAADLRAFERRLLTKLAIVNTVAVAVVAATVKLL